MEVQEFNVYTIKKTVFTHKTKGHTYKVLEILKSKHPDTDEWYDAVLYIQLESSELFVRSEESFIKDFNIRKL